jgi:hypothetical protein
MPRGGRCGHHFLLVCVHGRLLFKCLITTFGLFYLLIEKLKREGQTEMDVFNKPLCEERNYQEGSLDLQNRKMNENFRIFQNRA